jgi:hypothetical protein
MKRPAILILTILLFSLAFAACGPTEEEEQANATQIAAEIFATQTAAAPTATHTPTNTPTFTPMPTSTTTPAPTDTPVPTPTPTPVSALALLENALAAQEQASSYHFDTELQMSLEQEGISMDIPMIFSGDFQSPDRMRGTFSMSFFGLTVEMEQVTIGDMVYATNPESGEWEVGEEPVTPFAVEDLTALDAADLEDLVFLGVETLDDIEVYHLQGVATGQALGEAFGEIEEALQVEYWIEVESGYLRQSALEGELTFEDEDTSLFGEIGAGKISMVMMMTFSNHNEDVVIEAPEVSHVASEMEIKDCPNDQILCVGLVTDLGELDESAFFQAAWEGVKLAESEMRAVVDFLETMDPSDYAANIDLFAENGYDIIVTVGFGLGETTSRAAGQFPDIDFIGVDQYQVFESENAVGLLFPEDEAGFMAGALAGMLTESNRVAAVLGSEVVPPIVAFKEGYEAGARYVNPGTLADQRWPSPTLDGVRVRPKRHLPWAPMSCSPRPARLAMGR